MWVFLYEGPSCFRSNFFLKVTQFVHLSFSINPWCVRVYWKLPHLPNLSSVSQNKRTQQHFKCSWFTTEPVVHLRVVQLTWNFGSSPKIGICGLLIFYLLSFWPTVTTLPGASSILCQKGALYCQYMLLIRSWMLFVLSLQQNECLWWVFFFSVTQYLSSSISPSLVLQYHA